MSKSHEVAYTINYTNSISKPVMLLKHEPESHMY